MERRKSRAVRQRRRVGLHVLNAYSFSPFSQQRLYSIKWDLSKPVDRLPEKRVQDPDANIHQQKHDAADSHEDKRFPRAHSVIWLRQFAGEQQPDRNPASHE